MKPKVKHQYDPHIYLPEGINEGNASFKKIIEKAKVRTNYGSGKTLNLEIYIDRWINLATINLTTNFLNLSYPYMFLLDDNDIKDMVWYCFSNKCFKLQTAKVNKHSKFKKASGLKAHVQGSAFEEYCEQELQGQTDFRNQMVEVILKDLNKNPSTTQVMFSHCGREMVETLAERKTQPKSDIKAMVIDNKNNETLTVGISAKKTPVSTQIHMCSIDSFKTIMNLKFNVIMNTEVETALKKFTGCDGYTPRDLLEPVKLAQMVKQPARFYLQQLTDNEQQAIKKFFKDNLPAILRLVISEGSVKDEDFYAKYLITNKVKYLSPEDFKPELQKFEDLIKEISKEEVSFSDNGGTIKIGSKITIQAKGSGTPSQRSCLQFRKSL